MEKTIAQKIVATSSQVSKEREYWLNKLAGKLHLSNLPYDFHHFGDLEKDYRQITFKLPESLAEKMIKLSNNSDSNLFMVMVTCLNILLWRYTNTSDILVGSPIYQQEIEGEFVNTILVLRNQVNGGMTCKELLLQVRKTLAEANDHVNYPIKGLIAELEIVSNSVNSGLFDIGIMLENVHYYRYLEQASYNLLFDLKREDNGIHGLVEYNGKRYKEETIERYINHLIRVFQLFIADLNQPLGEINLLTQEEVEQITVTFNQTTRRFPLERTVYQLFAEQVSKNPERLAIRCGEVSLSYCQLAGHASVLAELLSQFGLNSDAIVAIIAEPSVEMFVGIIGVLQAGGAYLPIDADLPPERIQYMLQDSQAKILLTTSKLNSEIQYSGEVLYLKELGVYQDTNNELNVTVDQDEIELKLLSTFENQGCASDLTQMELLDGSETYKQSGLSTAYIGEQNPRNLVYTIYTSGTTGQPKAVAVENLSLVNYCFWFNDQVGLTSKDRSVLLSAFCFDLGYTSIFPALLSGAELHVLPKQVYADPEELLNYLKNSQITYIKTTPSLFNMLVNTYSFAVGDHCQSLRLVLLGGEEINLFDVDRFHKLYSDCQVMNHYGPTECTIGSITHQLDFTKFADYQLLPVIGKAIANVQIYILNEEKNIVPLGVSGELYIGGACLARGYLNRSELTEEKFIYYHGQRLYRTGDRGRYLPDGTIQFMGRMDNQVKIRGYRIEPGEIEQRLLQHPMITDVVVLSGQDQGGMRYLCGYYVATEELSVTEVRERLARDLPEYMIPAYLIQLDQMPLTPNGKIDRKALPGVEGHLKLGTVILPENEIEERVLQIWKEVLGISEIGVTHNFFDLGGNSLNATSIVSRLHKEFNAEISLGQLFSGPIVRDVAKYLAKAEESIFTSITVVEKRDFYPVSSAQKRLFILNQLEPDSANYNISLTMLIEGELDVKRLETAFKELIKRHETLRTSFGLVEGELVQRVYENVEFELEREEYLEELENTESLKRVCQQFAVDYFAPFDLSKAPLIKSKLIRLHTCYLLLCDLHHIIADGTTVSILMNELIRLYDGQSLPELKLQYKDVANWQYQLTSSGALQKHEKYWLTKFSGEIPLLQLPTDYPRPAVMSFEGEKTRFMINQEITVGLNQLATKSGATLYMVLLAALDLLLAKYSSQEEIIIGSPIAGRPHTDLEQIVGMFANTLVMRGTVSPDKSFIQLLDEVKADALLAYEHQNYQFDMLVDSLNLSRDMSRNPLFDVMLVLQNYENKPVELAERNLRFEPVVFDNQTAKFDLLFNAREMNEGILMRVEYASRLFCAETIQRMNKHFIHILEQIVAHPEQLIAEIKLLTAEEQDQILQEFNEIKEGYADQTLIEKFEKRVAEAEDKLALIFDDGQRFSYGELNRLANRLAHRLRNSGVGPESIVGLLAERSPEMIIAILGILKAGGAYLPIDPTYPVERIAYMLQDSGAELLLTNVEIPVELAYSEEIIRLNDPYLSMYAETNPKSRRTMTDLLYVIYTSGSTGEPKGVMLEECNLCNLINYATQKTPVSYSSRVLQFASISFDVSFQEMFSTFISGGELYVVGQERRNNVIKLLEYITTHQIQVVFFPTALCKYIFSEEDLSELVPDCITDLIVAGEQLIVNERMRLALQTKEIILHNHYGPSETHVVTMISFNPRTEIELVPSIGYPISNVRIYILDQEQNLLPIGVPGELCVAGANVGRGYLGKTELTSERFVPDPWVLGERMYHTGDQARWLTDGQIEFMGRLDHQVKIRGYRIELEEIESQLLDLAQVKEAGVIAKEDSSGSLYLAAFVVLNTGATLTDIRSSLSRVLPDYMIPERFIVLDHLPLTVTGKVDRRGLARLSVEYSTDRKVDLPTNEIEEHLVSIWEEILNQKNIGVTDDFFELGGHSLRATSLISRVYRTFQVNLPLREVFKTPTIRELAHFIKEAEKTTYYSIDQVSEAEDYPVSSAQKRVMIVNQQHPESIRYNMPGILLLEGRLDLEQFTKTIQALIERHEAFRTSFVSINGEPRQRVHRHVEFTVNHLDMTEVSLPTGISDDSFGEFPEKYINELIAPLIKPFDLASAPLLRVNLIHFAGAYLLVFDIHHIIADYISLNVIYNDFARIYAGQRLEPLRIQYKDFAVWQQKFYSSDKLDHQKEYWLNQLKGMMYTELPRKNLAAVEEESSVQLAVINSDLTKRLTDYCNQNRVTRFTMLLAIFNVILTKKIQQEEITLGTPISGRRDLELEKVVGIFLNILPIRNYVAGELSFKEFLIQVEESVMAGRENQDYPYEEMYIKMRELQNYTAETLFSISFNYLPQYQHDTEVNLDELNIKRLLNEKVEAKTKLTLHVFEGQDELYLRTLYRSDLYEEYIIQKILRDFQQVSQIVLSDDSIKIADIDLADTDETDDFVSDFGIELLEMDFD